MTTPEHDSTLWFGIILIVFGIVGLMLSTTFNIRGNKRAKSDLSRLMGRYDLIKGEIEHHISNLEAKLYPEDDESSLKKLSLHGIVKLEQRLTLTPSRPIEYGYWTLTDKGRKLALKTEKKNL